MIDRAFGASAARVRAGVCASALLVAALALAACGSTDDTAPRQVDPVGNPSREILDTQLAFDVATRSATATITFGPSASDGASLETGDLTLDSVSHPFAADGGGVVLGLPASDRPLAVDVAFHYLAHDNGDGAHSGGFTLVWPYFCGNLFPCHSEPSDGTTFSLSLTGAAGTAVFPERIPSPAPSYQIAWAIGSYTELAVGTTTAGTQISAWHPPAQAAEAVAGTRNLVAAFDWLERTLGPYTFGPKAGTVAVPGALGGMEHHPYWHVAPDLLSDEVTNVHEAVHGWFGGGVRIACWEDFVLSEGTTTYLAGRALDVVAPSVGAAVWESYARDVASLDGAAPVWPQGCGAVDILQDGLFSLAPYLRGAYFYRGVALKVGADRLDQALAAFYTEHVGRSATMSAMLETIRQVTGYDPAACADLWLRSTTMPAPGACP